MLRRAEVHLKQRRMSLPKYRIYKSQTQVFYADVEAVNIPDASEKVWQIPDEAWEPDEFVVNIDDIEEIEEDE